MSGITGLDLNEIANYSKVSEGKGILAHDALETYCDRLVGITTYGFNLDDASTAGEVVKELQIQVRSILDAIDDVDDMIDDLINTIQTDIIDKENDLSATILDI